MTDALFFEYVGDGTSDSDPLQRIFRFESRVWYYLTDSGEWEEAVSPDALTIFPIDEPWVNEWFLYDYVRGFADVVYADHFI